MIGEKGLGKAFLRELKGKKLKKEQLLVILLAGILLLIIAIPDGNKKNAGEEKQSFLSENLPENTDTEEEYVAALERRLEKLLSQMDGAGEVSVMITLAASKERVVEKDLQESNEKVEESDSQGGSRTTSNTSRSEEAVYGGREENSQSPYVSKELSPEVEGVVVIAPGGDNALVIKNITEAVQALFGIDTHKIRIVKGRREA